jgi:hypothetical protein
MAWSWAVAAEFIVTWLNWFKPVEQLTSLRKLPVKTGLVQAKVSRIYAC